MLTIIPDIHADPKRLSASLAAVNKSSSIGFLGDFIDAGSDRHSTVDEFSVLTEVRQLIDTKEAVGVMGNHELNAILFHRRGASGQPLRPHDPKNLKQHLSFIETFGIETDEAMDWTSWFLKALPLWREIDGLRLVHAFWSDKVIEIVRERRPDGLLLVEDLPEIAAESSAFGRAVKLLVSGPELPLPGGATIKDFKDHSRTDIRIAWWRNGAKSWRELALSVQDPTQVPDIPLELGQVSEFYPFDVSPVLVGHYKMNPPIRLEHSKAACLDYPYAPCVYHWGGEESLEPSNFLPAV